MFTFTLATLLTEKTFSYKIPIDSLQRVTSHVMGSNLLCSAREQTRKWRLKLTLVRLQTRSLTALGEGM